ncbi:MAG: ABC transporter substrate-binding protein [Candidatus Asgardarchaeia archaeon]
MNRKQKAIVAFTMLFLLLPIVSVAATVGHAQEEKYFFTIHTLIMAGSEEENVGLVLKEEYAKIGINLELHYATISDIIARTFGNYNQSTYEGGGYDALLIERGQGFDPDAVRAYYHSDGWPPNGGNIAFYTDGRLDRLMDAAAEETNFTRRKELYWEINEMVREAMIDNWLYYPKITMLTKKSILNVTPFVDLRSAENWTVEGKTRADNVTVVFAQGGEIDALNPLFMGSGYAARPLFLVLGGAVIRWSTNGTLIKGVITDHYEFSPDYMNVTFYLKKGIKWHDGYNFTAWDIKCYYDALLDPETGSWGTYSAQSWLKNVTVVDNYTVTFQLVKKMAPNLVLVQLSYEEGYMPYHILKDVPHSEWKTHWTNTERAIGYGPFKWYDWKKGEYLVLKANPDYIGGEPFIDNLVVRVIPDSSTAYAALKSGDVDVLSAWYGFTSLAKEAEEDPDLRVYTSLVTGVTSLFLNNLHPQLSNKYVRYALAYATPRDEIVNEVIHGYGVRADQFQYTWSWGANPNLDPIPYDINKAREYMELAGFKFAYLEYPSTIQMLYYALAGVGVAAIAIGFGIGFIFAKKKVTS